MTPPDLTPIRVPASLLPLTRALSALWTPPSRLPLSVWAEANMTLSSEYAARASRLRLFGWQREIFDTFTDTSVSSIVLFTARQLTKTILIQAASAYVVCEDPGPILVLQPDVDAARSFSRERLAPMIRDNICLRGKLSDSPHDGNMLLMKEFPGGSLALVGTRSSSSLRRRSVRFLFADEVDAYLLSVGTAENKEGDPLTIAAESMVTFGSRAKSILASTPTTAGRSRIAKAYAASDQRKPYVPCPFCGHMQVLRFHRAAGGGGVWFDSSLSHDKSPATARYECEAAHCHKRWTDNQRKAACEKAEWRAAKPFAGVAGFWISQLYSPWITLSILVDKFLRTKDSRDLYKAFANTVLAEEWQEDGETPDAELLFRRTEDYEYGADAVVPRPGLFLTAMVDVQDSPPRLEVEVAAWGRGRERWSIAYLRLQVFAENGQPLPVTSPELWDVELARVLAKEWRHASGHTLPIMAMGIDTGHKPKPVYDFARKHPQLSYSPGAGLRVHATRTVIPTKGNDDALRIISAVSKEDAIKKRQGVRIVSIGTHCIKQQLFDLLKHVRPAPDGSPTSDCYHFPRYDMHYFNGLCSEVRIVDAKGKVSYSRRPGADRNEPLDLSVGNRAVASIVGIDRFTETHWRQLETALDPSTVLQPVLHSTLSGVDVPASASLASPTPNPEAGGTERADPNHATTGSSASPLSPITHHSTPSTPAIPVPASPAPAASPRTRPIRGRF